jgi:hypothetical protein
MHECFFVCVALNYTLQRSGQALSFWDRMFFYFQPTTDNRQLTTDNLQPTTYNLQPTTYNFVHLS